MSTINLSDAGRRLAWKTQQPWPLERWLQVAIATMAVLGTWLLGMGKRDLSAALLTVMIAPTAVYLVDVKRWVRVNLLVANLAGLLLGIQLWYALAARESKLIALADSLVYLQLVLMFCSKNARIYWYLALLSLLQVAVASAINLGVVFGFVLFLYVQVAILTLALFYLVRESQQFDRAALSAADTNEATVVPRRWPLAGRAAGFSGRGGDALDRPALRALGRRAISFALGSVAVASVIFIVLPRLGHTSWSDAHLNARRVVGFSDQVTLGTLGAVTDNAEEVMNVRFTRHMTGESYPLAQPPLFRGTVLSTYNRGEWLKARSPRPSASVRGRTATPKPPPPGAELIDQTITIEPLDTPIVFSIFPATVTRPNEGLLSDPDDASGRQLFRSDNMRQQRVEYKLSLTGMRNGRQLPITPVNKALSEEQRQSLLALPSDRDQIDPLAGLKDIARRQIDGIATTNKVAQARALELFLRDTGGFTYSLQPVQRDPALDPAEDFMTNHKSGHCEYFATALALMLREVGIPSRVVVGFRGDEYNSLGDFYQVRQLHAHAWVEAYLEPGEIPTGQLPKHFASAEGGWLRLDPTASTTAFTQTGRGWLGLPAMRETLDFCQFLWSRYVLGMDAGRQRQSVYGPVAAVAANIVKKPFSAETYTGLGHAVRLFFSLMIDSFRQGRWFNWRGGLTAVIVLLTAVALWRLARWTSASLVAWWTRERSAERRELARRVEFYHRMETLLARHQLQRSDCQTQREFASLAAGQLAELDATRPVADAPGYLAELFYRIRFGRAKLEADETDRVREMLARLRASLAPARTGRRLSRMNENR